MYWCRTQPSGAHSIAFLFACLPLYIDSFLAWLSMWLPDCLLSVMCLALLALSCQFVDLIAPKLASLFSLTNFTCLSSCDDCLTCLASCAHLLLLTMIACVLACLIVCWLVYCSRLTAKLADCSPLLMVVVVCLLAYMITHNCYP